MANNTHMKKVGILPYLEELSRRYNRLAKTSSDPKTQFVLEGLSIEIGNKADELSKAFVVEPDPKREQR